MQLKGDTMAKKIVVTMADLQEDDLGVCVACGLVDSGYESDARCCECPECEKLAMYGMMAALEDGKIEVGDDDDDCDDCDD